MVYKFENITPGDLKYIKSKKIFNVKVKFDKELIDGTIVGFKEKNNNIFFEVFFENEKYQRQGSLFVPGSYNDSVNISNLIMSKWFEYEEIIISRDCHKQMHISNKWFWKVGENANMIFQYENVVSSILHPSNFQKITYIDVLNKIWVPVNQTHYSYCLYYLYELENSKKYTHTIWENHCIVDYHIPLTTLDYSICKNTYIYDNIDKKIIINDRINNEEISIDDDLNTSNYGYVDSDFNLDDFFYNSSIGFDIIFNIKKAIQFWKKNWFQSKGINKKISIIDIGFNVFTETYSVFKSEVEDKCDPLTSLNISFLEKINSSNSELHICGEALSHVVKSSIEDLMLMYSNKLSNITILLNCTSSLNITYYKEISRVFILDAKAKGILIKNFENGELVDAVV